jgi:Ca2+-transporting ATPase
MGAGYRPKGAFYAAGANDALTYWPEVLTLTLRIGVLCNGAELRFREAWTVVGDPTEGALLAAAAKAGLWKDPLEQEEPAVLEIPFDSERKKMTLLRRTSDGFRAYVKGAPDVILRTCRFIQLPGRIDPFTDALRQEVLDANRQLASKGLRVLAMAYRDFVMSPDTTHPETLEQELVFAGLEAMQDPPRPEAAPAVRHCGEAGIRTVMMTGDHLETARSVATELGILDDHSAALTGADVDMLSDDDLARRIQEVAVFARVTAEHKLRIVRAWQARQAVVAMTGDGVNDAPALKEADIGIAMGITGTDVTKAASDMIVLDDNFASIVAAVEDGRGIYENIRKFVFYLLSGNTGEVLVMLGASLAGWPLPLLPVQILWVNLLTDGLPALALGVDPYSRDLMRQPVRGHDDNIFDRTFTRDLFGIGMVIAACTLAAFAYLYFIEKSPIGRARSVAFSVLVGTHLIHAFNARHARLSIFQIGFFSNVWLVLAVAISLALQLIILSWPPAQTVFKTQSPVGLEWAYIVGLAVVPLIVVEILKAWRRRPVSDT